VWIGPIDEAARAPGRQPAEPKLAGAAFSHVLHAVAACVRLHLRVLPRHGAGAERAAHAGQPAARARLKVATGCAASTPCASARSTTGGEPSACTLSAPALASSTSRRSAYPVGQGRPAPSGGGAAAPLPGGLPGRPAGPPAAHLWGCGWPGTRQRPSAPTCRSARAPGRTPPAPTSASSTLRWARVAGCHARTGSGTASACLEGCLPTQWRPRLLRFP